MAKIGGAPLEIASKSSAGEMGGALNVLSLQFAQNQPLQLDGFRNRRRELRTRFDRLSPEPNCGNDRGTNE